MTCERDCQYKSVDRRDSGESHHSRDGSSKKPFVLLDDEREEQQRVIVPALERSILAADRNDAGYVESGSALILEE